MALIDDVKICLRISSSNTAYDTEINDLINTAITDLKLSGVTAESAVDTDILVKRAITVYVKANFGWNNPDSEKLQLSYQMLKQHMSLSSDYAFYAVTFKITDNDTSQPMRNVKVVFNSVNKTTDENGQAVFHVRKGSNYVYEITADGYQSDIDDDNLLDIAASQTVQLSLIAI